MDLEMVLGKVLVGRLLSENKVEDKKLVIIWTAWVIKFDYLMSYQLKNSLFYGKILELTTDIPLSA